MKSRNYVPDPRMACWAFVGFLLASLAQTSLLAQTCGDQTCDPGEDELVCGLDCATAVSPDAAAGDATRLSLYLPENGRTLILETSDPGPKILRALVDGASAGVAFAGMEFQQASGAATTVTLSGLEPLLEYHLYRDTYANHEVLLVDAEGRAAFPQDTSGDQFTWIETTSSNTIFIREHTKCAFSNRSRLNSGLWDPITRTCTLTVDLSENVEIAEDNLTLDCAGHGIRVSTFGFAVLLSGRSGVTVRNCMIENLGTGIGIGIGSGNRVENNQIAATFGFGILSSGSTGLQVSRNLVNSPSSAQSGILVQGGSNLVVAENEVTGASTGIRFISRDSLLTGNRIAASRVGLDLSFSLRNTLRNNLMTGNRFNFRLAQSIPNGYEQDIDTSNLVDGKPILFLKDISNALFDAATNAGTFFCVRCDGITIRDLSFQNNGSAITLFQATNSLVESIIADQNEVGFRLDSSTRNTLRGNVARSGDTGFLLLSSPRNLLAGNRAEENTSVGFVTSSENSLVSNTSLNSSGFRISSLSAVTDNSASTTFSFAEVGFSLSGSGSILMGNRTTGFRDAFQLNSAISNRLVGNVAAGGGQANFRIQGDSSDNELEGNTARFSIFGFLIHSGGNRFMNNEASDNTGAGFGLRFGFGPPTGADFNTISSNRVLRNGNIGIWIDAGMDGNLLFNNFVDASGSFNARDEGNNSWNLPAPVPGTSFGGGPFLGGNLWGDYRGRDHTRDGIGDNKLPYTSNGEIRSGGDFLPLVPVDQDGDRILAGYDNCPATANPDQSDFDADGSGAACDCDDGDPRTRPGAMEVNDGIDNQCAGDPGAGMIDEIPDGLSPSGLALEDGFSWTPQVAATSYGILRSPVPTFDFDCLSVPTIQPTWNDPESPSAGTAFFYLVRPLLPFPGSWGQDSAGNERLPRCL